MSRTGRMIKRLWIRTAHISWNAVIRLQKEQASQYRFGIRPEKTWTGNNIAFESAFSYHLGIVIQAPVYDTMCAAQMTQNGDYSFRRLKDSGLKTLSEELLGYKRKTFTETTDGRSFSVTKERPLPRQQTENPLMSWIRRILKPLHTPVRMRTRRSS